MHGMLASKALSQTCMQKEEISPGQGPSLRERRHNHQQNRSANTAPGMYEVWGSARVPRTSIRCVTMVLRTRTATPTLPSPKNLLYLASSSRIPSGKRTGKGPESGQNSYTGRSSAETPGLKNLCAHKKSKRIFDCKQLGKWKPLSPSS